MRVPVLKGADLSVPTSFIRNPAVLGLKPAEVLMVLHVCNTPILPGDQYPAVTLKYLGDLMGLTKGAIAKWKSSLEKKGYLKTTPKMRPDGRTAAVYWDLSPLWAALEGISAPKDSTTLN